MKKTLLVAALATITAVSGQASLFTFSVSLDGASEVPPNASTAVGSGSGIWDSSTGILTVGGAFAGLTAPATAAHVHTGAAGVAGGVKFALTVPAAISGSFSGSGLITGGDVATLFASGYYVNIHDSAFPGGEIRGQLVPLTPIPEPETYAAMAGAALVGFGLWRRARR